jgi:two-component system, LuxR family, response regulator FixJ
MSGTMNSATVFIVEDDPETRGSFVALVSSLGLEVEAFASGEEFLQASDAQRPGCAVVDFRLGGIDGIELHRRLLQAGCALPVILISACLSVRAASGALEQGVFRVLEKPYRSDELAAAIQDAIQRDRELRQQKLYRLDFEHRLESLDARERRTLDLVLAGYPNKVIERRLGLSRRTVERIRSSILEKMDSLSFVELSAAHGEASVAEGQVKGQKNWRLLCCDLHDGAAQYLSAALLRLQAIEAQHDLPEAAAPHLRMAGVLLSVALGDIRDVIAGRSPSCFLRSGIVPSIKRLVQELAEAGGIEIEFVEGLGHRKLSPLLQMTVYRICQESINNAIRHSGSDRVRVEIVADPEVLRLEVRDWGVGFDPGAIGADCRGLRGVCERAELLGGRASVESRPGWGTLVAVELPIRSGTRTRSVAHVRQDRPAKPDLLSQ